MSGLLCHIRYRRRGFRFSDTVQYQNNSTVGIAKRHSACSNFTTKHRVPRRVSTGKHTRIITIIIMPGRVCVCACTVILDVFTTTAFTVEPEFGCFFVLLRNYTQTSTRRRSCDARRETEPTNAYNSSLHRIFSFRNSLYITIIIHIYMYVYCTRASNIRPGLAFFFRFSKQFFYGLSRLKN